MKTRLSFTLIVLCGICIFSIQTMFGQSRTTSSTKTTKTKSISNVGTAPKAVLVKSQSQVRREAKNHFKGMKYNYSVSRNSRSRNQAVNSYKGGGTVRLKGKSVQFNWYMTTDSKGDVVHMYVGDSEMTGFGTLGVTRGDHGRRKAGCLAKEGEARKRCLDRLWIETTTDCLLSNTKSQCKTDCWYRGGYCYPDKR